MSNPKSIVTVAYPEHLGDAATQDDIDRINATFCMTREGGGNQMTTALRMATVVFAIACVAHAGEIRTWTGTNGKTLQAELVRESGGQVTLRTRDGRIIQTKRSSLSRSDGGYLDSLKVSAPTPRVAAPTPLPKPKGPPADSSPLLTKTDRFGVRLGESTETLEWNCRQAGEAIDKDAWVFEDKDHPGRIWSFAGALNGNDAVKTTEVSVYNGRVYQVKVLFKDSSLQNYKVLTGSLEKKYGKNKAGLRDAMESKSGFSTSDGEHKVQIVLNHDLGFMEDDTLSLRYVHDALSDQVMEEIERRKASKVADDL